MLLEESPCQAIYCICLWDFCLHPTTISDRILQFILWVIYLLPFIGHWFWKDMLNFKWFIYMLWANWKIPIIINLTGEKTLRTLQSVLGISHYLQKSEPGNVGGRYYSHCHWQQEAPEVQHPSGQHQTNCPTGSQSNLLPGKRGSWEI